MRPANRRVVTVLITGLSFNTPDSQVKHYIESFGAKMVGIEPIYGVYKEGPWRGQYNGERRYKVDFSEQIIPMGTYHLLNSDKIKVIYPGNTRTCGRCHQAPSSCPGGGIARVCGEQGGERTTLYQHMKLIWEKTRYDPGAEPVENDDNDEDAIPDLANMREESFTGNPSDENEASSSVANEDSDKNENDEGREHEDSQQEDGDTGDDENDDIESSVQNHAGNEFIIPGLIKPLSKSQKKKLRRNKRKDATTPPEPKETKFSKLSVNPATNLDGQSLVTNLIRKYSSTENNDYEESEEEAPSASTGDSSKSTAAATSRPSSNSSAASPSGSVISKGTFSESTTLETSKPSSSFSVASPTVTVIPTGVK